MEITGKELQEKIKNGDKLIVDFWAKFCGPCKTMKPIFDKVAEEMRNNNSDVELYTMDVEENRDFAVAFGVRAVPTIKTFSNGEEVYSQPGMKVESEIKELINQLNG